MAAGGLLVGRIGGAPVRIGASWLLLAALVVIVIGPQIAQSRPDLGPLAYAVALASAVLLLVSVLLHEAAHALTARGAGLRVHAIVADLWGGHTTFEGHSLRPGSAAVIAAAGPLTNAVLGVASLVAERGMTSGVPRHLVYGLAVSNLLLAGFNLLPGLPLDGGQLVESAVWAASGSRPRGTVVAGWCGRVLVLVVAIYWVALPVLRGEGLSMSLVWGLLIAGFLWRGATVAIQSGTVLGRIESVRVADLLIRVPGVTETTAVERVWAEPAGAAVVHDPSGAPVGLVTRQMVEQLPPERRATTPVSAVYVRMPPSWVVDADPHDPVVDVVRPMAEAGLSLAAVRSGGRIAGVLRVEDVDPILRGSAPPPR